MCFNFYSLSPESIPKHQDSKHPNADTKVRSASDILSVISKSQASNSGSIEEGEDHVKKGDESYHSEESERGNPLLLQGNQLIPLGESSHNIPHHGNFAYSKESFRNARSFNVPKKQVEGVKSGWNNPCTTGVPPGLGRGMPGEENQTPADVK